MKILALLLVSGLIAEAVPVQLGWDRNPEPDVIGYRLYQGDLSGVYTQMTDVGNVLTWIVNNLTDGNHYFALTAYNSASLESRFGNEISVLVQSTLRINGHIFYCTGGSLMNVSLALTGTFTASASSDTQGNYTFIVPVGGSYTVTPSKAPLSPGTGPINTVDVVACQRHYLGLISLTGCKAIAGDVNGDGRITTVDVVAIQRFLTGSTSGTGSSGHYQFAPINRIYPVIVIDQLVQDYSGLLYGDVVL